MFASLVGTQYFLYRCPESIIEHETSLFNQLDLQTTYSQLLGKSIDKAWKVKKTPEALQEAHARKLLLIENGVSSIAETMNEITVLLCKACGYLAISDTPRDVHALYVAWLIASDLKSAISNTNMKVGDLRGASLTKSLFTDIATQVKIEVKAKVESNGNYSVADADELMKQWFYFVFGKSIGKPNTRIVYDVHCLIEEGKVRKPLYQPKPFVELSPEAARWITSLNDKSLFSNRVGKKNWPSS